MSQARSRPTTTRRARGFTLVELLVSMVAGLIVALAVVGLSSQATNTFHEESRIASAEMQIRTAIDRLRADVARASLMSTGNIWIDPNIYNATPGQKYDVSGTNISYKTATTAPTAPAMTLYSLAGMRLWQGGSVPGAALSGVNNLSPDMIDLAGNMTSVEVLQIGGTKGSTHHAIEKTGCGGNGWRIYLNFNSSPALWRLVGMGPTGTSDTYGTQLQNAFQPAVPSGAAGFIVRVFDNTTHKAQYLAMCGAPAACPHPPAGMPPSAACWNPGAGGVPDPYIDLDATSSSTFDPSSLAGGVDPSNATINPVQIVRWQIQPSLVNPPTDAGGDTAKYDLTRWYLTADGNTAGNPEVIAEYAVDLKFAFTVDTTTDTTGAYVLPPAGGGSEPQIVYSFEDATNATIAEDVFTQGTTVPLAPGSNGPQPQRVRSVRMRLVTRTMLQDRDKPLVVNGAPNDYLYRYCTVNDPAACCTANPTTCTTTTPIFARTRTLISEYSLQNQASMWFE